MGLDRPLRSARVLSPRRRSAGSCGPEAAKWSTGPSRLRLCPHGSESHTLSGIKKVPVHRTGTFFMAEDMGLEQVLDC